jgi:hypothetical protein
VAAAFLQHLRQLRIPDPEEVLHGRAALDPKLREDELMTLFSAMAGILQQYEKQRRPETLACAQRFLQGALQVAQANKADAIYTTLRSMVQQGRLQNWAQHSENVLYLLKSLDPYYEHISDLLEEMRYKVQPGGN